MLLQLDYVHLPLMFKLVLMDSLLPQLEDKMSNVLLVTLLTLLLVTVVHSPSLVLLDIIPIMVLVLYVQPTLFLAHSD